METQLFKNQITRTDDFQYIVETERLGKQKLEEYKEALQLLIMEALLEQFIHDDSIETAIAYGDPGLTIEEDKFGLLLINSPSDLEHIEEFMAHLDNYYDYQYYDEYISYNGKLWAIGGVYGEQSYRIVYGDIITIENDIDDWIEYCKYENAEDLTNSENRSIRVMHSQFEEQLEEEGFKLIADDQANGLHPHQNDEPKDFAYLLEEGEIKELIFIIDAISQFSVTFSVYGR